MLNLPIGISIGTIQKDYQSVILHVVYFNDTDVLELKNAGIPTLELKNYIDEQILKKYQSLENHFEFIPCEISLNQRKFHCFFSEENLLRKLDEKSIEIEKLLLQSKNNYEAVLFQKLAYSFGLKVNAEIYQNIAENIDFKVIQKISQNQFQLESLLLGKEIY
jgi:methionine aminopeptidase